MNKYKGFSKIWFLGLLLVAFVAGCASNPDEIQDTTPPTVTVTSPTNTAVEVPVNRKVSVAFSEAMDPATITFSSFSLRETISGTVVNGAVTPASASAIFAPVADLKLGTEYSVTIKGGLTGAVKDLAGNSMVDDFTFTFTTAEVIAVDITAPTIIVTSPTDTAIAVPINRIVHVAFSEEMDPTTISAASFSLKETLSGTNVPGDVSSVGAAATFAPTSPLKFSTNYTATVKGGAIPGVKDLAGNAMVSDFVFTFTTGAIADTTAPTVTFTSPTDTAGAVSINRIVQIGFSEAMYPASINTASVSMKETLSGNSVTGTVTGVDTSASFNPLTQLKYSTKYTVTIKGGNAEGVKDLAGNAMVNDYLFSFTTGPVADTTAPTIIVTGALNGATGLPVNRASTATFSEQMNASTLASPATSFTICATATAGGACVTPVTGVVTYSGNTVTFTPGSPLANNTWYKSTISTGAKDLAGNALASGLVPNPWNWQTGAAADTTAPKITMTNPANLATLVPVNQKINATFNEEMKQSTMVTANFSLKETLLGTAVVGTVAYNVLNNIATFSPLADLKPDTSYTVTVSNGATDLAGNALVVPAVDGLNPWTFRTAAAVVIPPPASLIDLGSAGAFGIMATSAITNTGAATMINGDVSLDPGSSNGLLPVQVNGTIHINDPVSALARIDLLAAYNAAKALAPGVTVPGGMDLGAFPNGGLPGVLPPGTYTSGSTMLISTPLTLDGQGDANASWVFQIGSSLTTTNSVSLINGAQAKNVYWVPTASATVGVGTIFYGNIIAGVSATGQTGAVINGRILAGATNPGTIALDTNTVNVPAP